MLTKEEFQNILKQYPLTSTGHNRNKYLKKLIPALNRKEILILKGIRRCGKSTILKQLIQYLMSEGVKKEQIMYVNFDDYNFLPHLNLKLLEFILNQLDLKLKCFLFLDEIQKIPHFESWLRTHYERETNVKFIISGSTSSLVSKEFGTVLTGRNLTFEIFPLDYGEFKDFSDLGFEEFITYGGFPEVVLEKNFENKRNLLRNYITDIINKDIFEKHKINDPKQFIYFAQYLFNNPGIRLSINKLSKNLEISKDTVKNYIYYMTESYLIFEVPFFSYSAKSKFIANNVPKYYVLDNGFYLVNTARKETSKQIEAVIAQKFFRGSHELFYWKGKQEVDFIVKNNAYNVVSSKEIPEREFLGLSEIFRSFKHITKLSLLSQISKPSKDNIQFLRIEEFLCKE